MIMGITPISTIAITNNENHLNLQASHITKNDINGHWAEETLKNWSEKGWLKGDEQNLYHPNENITRGEFMALINRMKDYKETSPDIDKYSDVSKTDWYYDVVSTALSAGYIKGTSNESMSPKNPITRQEAMTIIANISGASNQDTSILNTVSDGSKISEWAKSSVAACINEGIVTGFDGKIQPTTNMTRAESVVMMDRLDMGIRIYYFPGIYSSGNSKLKTSSVTISNDNITLENMEIDQNLTISSTVEEGEVKLKNLKIKNNLYVYGGGANSVYLNNVIIGNDLILNKKNGKLKIVARGESSAKLTTIQSGATFISSDISGVGFETIEIPKNFIENQKILLDGKFINLKNYAEKLQISATGSIENLDAYAHLTLEGNSKINKVNIHGNSIVNINGKDHKISPPEDSNRETNDTYREWDYEEDYDNDDFIESKDETWIPPVDDDDDFNVGFINLNPDDYEELPQGDELPNWLLYGYNVLNYGYINSDNINRRHSIFDKNKVKEEYKEDGEYKGHYRIEEGNFKSNLKTMVSKSATDLYSSFDTSASAKYSGLFFSGNLQAEYGLTTDRSETSVLIKQIEDHRTQTVAYNNISLSELKGLLSENFLNDVEKYATGSASTNTDYNPDYILTYYGTHAIMQYDLGGRAELSYIFNNKTLKSTQEIKISAEANYKNFSGSANSDEVEISKMVSENSSMSFLSIGGKNITGTTQAEVSSKYNDWVESINYAPVLCGISNITHCLEPIWNLIEDRTASENVRLAFDKAAENSQFELSKYDIQPKLPKFITDIVVCSDSNSKEAWAKIPQGYTSVRMNPGTDSKISLDTNKGNGGNYIYIAYKLSNKREEAITDIWVGYPGQTAPPGYSKINVDLNDGSKKGKKIYLYYKKITADEIKDKNTRCLKVISAVEGPSYTVPRGWNWPYYSSYADLNRGNEKAPFLYLVIKKENSL